MKKLSISAVIAMLFFAGIVTADAAYPVYPAYQATNNANQQYRQTGNQQYQIINQQGQRVLVPAQTVQSNGTVAAQPTRVTGTLPRVGSNTTNAGRQYYQPADYDRLADSGLYVGLSVGYTASMSGGMQADYRNENNAFFVPGAFKEASYKSDTIIPLQVSVGAAINNDFRADFSYMRYSGMEYPGNVDSSDGAGGYVRANVSGGAITANATMLNVYYNIDSYTGYLMGGALRPYIGAGVGISINTIADYVVLDNTFYSEKDPAYAAAGDLTGISDIYAYHNGGTNESLAYMLEGGITTDLDGGIKLDFFVRYSGLGKVKTSGSIVVSQTEWLGDGAGGEYEAPYDSVFHYTNWTESGRLSMIDLGIRLRLQF